jgi:hypothetical protein
MGWFHKNELDKIQQLIELGELPEAQKELKARLKRRFAKRKLGEVMNDIGVNIENFLDFQRGVEFELERNNQERALKNIKAAKRSLNALKKNIKHLVEVEMILEN